MKDINGEEFLVGDKLKVIKTIEQVSKFSVGDVVECILDDGSDACKFKRADDTYPTYYYNDRLQKL